MFRKIFRSRSAIFHQNSPTYLFFKSDLNAANMNVEKEIEKTKQANADRDKANAQVANLERQVSFGLVLKL